MTIDLQALYPKLINLMLDTVFVVDPDSRIVFVSDACEALLGYRAEEMVGHRVTEFVHPEDLEATRSAIVRVMDGQPHIDFSNRYLRKDGSVAHILWSAQWYEEEGVRIGVARDVTALRQAEAEIRYLAHHDALTGLTNRSLLDDRFTTALHAARRHHTGLAVLFLDLDHFKTINDVHGHVVGDRILCTLARRLEGCVRATDTVARVGGDEFIVLLTDVHSPEAVHRKVQQILASLGEPLGADLPGVSMPGCSIGVACYPMDGVDAETLLARADSEMYRVKGATRQQEGKPD